MVHIARLRAEMKPKNCEVLGVGVYFGLGEGAKGTNGADGHYEGSVAEVIA